MSEEVEAFLAHHGVKGMHWGVRRDLDPNGSGVSAATVKDTKASEKAKAVKSIASYETRSLEKLNPSVSDEEASRFTPEQKRALKIAAGVAVTSAVLAFGVYEAKNNPEAIAKIASMAGKKISPEEFKSNVDFSKAYSWQGNAVLKPSIVNHTEFTIPAGTTYHRIARDVEHSFSPATYATLSVEDFNRYLTSYGHVGGNPQHVSWESNSDIKVPGLPTVLGTFHEAMHENYSKAPRAVKKTLDAKAIGKNYLSPENVQRVYSAHTGGHWTDSVAVSFVSKLKEKGYGALVDDMDSGVLADSPIVLFSSEKMGAKRSVPNTEDIIAEAKRSLTELTNRKLPAHLQHADLEAFLAHHGVKGMRWHHHKPKDETEGESSGTSESNIKTSKSEAEAKKDYLALPPIRRNQKEAEKALNASQAKFEAKFEPSDAKETKTGLSEGQKKAIKIGIGVAAVGGIAALAIYANKKGNHSALPGEHIPLKNWYEGVEQSKAAAWGYGGYLKTSSYDRGDFTLPAGHVFHRLSLQEESGFRSSTYTAHSMDDFNRYVMSGTGTGDYSAHPGEYHISFSAKEPLKIPSLTNALEILRETMSEGKSEPATKEQARLLYEGLSGGDWSGRQATKFVKALTDKGYDALVDEMDSGVVADSPLVIFSHHKLGPKTSEVLTKDVISRAEKNLKELSSRKIAESITKENTAMAASDEVDAFLAHHGVKGMHWGVRKQRELELHTRVAKGEGSKTDKFIAANAMSALDIAKHKGSLTSFSKEKAEKLQAEKDRSKSPEEREAEAKKAYLAVPPIHRDSKEAARALSDSQAKSDAKLDPPEGETSKKGLSSGQKTAIKVGVGLAVVGGIVALGVYEDRKNQAFLSDLHSLAGKEIDPEKFTKGVSLSKLETWGRSGYVQPSSYEHAEFTIPAGHEFHRISKSAETKFAHATYSTPSIDDFHRYVVGFRGEKGTEDLHHISWSAKEPIKVPTLTTTLETLRETLNAHHQKMGTLKEGEGFSPEDVLKEYESMSGGAWKGQIAKSFFANLKEKGYGAIMDEMDAGVIGDKPLVLFDHEKMGPKSSVPFTTDAIKAAENNLKELTTRKFPQYAKAAKSITITKENTTLAASDPVEAFLAHNGVKGMHWGVHHQAKSDAVEFSKAKLAYGEGAGTRRKLIKAKVESRSKNPQYKEAFESHLAEQDLGKRARQAKTERHRKDVVKGTTKTARGVHRQLTGGFGQVSLASAMLAGAYVYARKSGVDKVLISKAQKSYHKHQDYSAAKAWFKAQGLG